MRFCARPLPRFLLTCRRRTNFLHLFFDIFQLSINSRQIRRGVTVRDRSFARMLSAVDASKALSMVKPTNPEIILRSLLVVMLRSLLVVVVGNLAVHACRVLGAE